MALMTEKRIGHLPVLEQGRLIGLISIGDVVRARLRLASRNDALPFTRLADLDALGCM
jgi:CBS domain-containing protein